MHPTPSRAGVHLGEPGPGHRHGVGQRRHPRGTVKAATARATSVPAPDTAPFDPEDETQTRARRIRGLDPSERTRALTELASQIGTAERNRRNGYPAPEPAYYERIRELVTNPLAGVR
jgi:hypothetical protein